MIRSVIRAGGSRARRLITGVVVVLVLTAGLAVATAAPADAYSVNCSGPRCTVYFNHEETNKYAYWGTIPQPPGSTFAAIWYFFAMTQRWFAIQYANRGMCIGFNLSLLPWESQGFFGYRC